MNFLIVDCLSLYNTIIGRPTLNSWKAATSTYHLSVKFPTEYGIGEVQGNQLTIRQCYLVVSAMDKQVQTMNIEERRTLVVPIEVLEDVPLDESNLKRFTRIEVSMGEKTKQDLVGFLKKSTYFFTCSHEDMSGIDPSVIYRLNVSLSYKSVHQKNKVFAPERDNAIKEEVHKLVTAEFIRKVYYLDWLANVVMVKKENGEYVWISQI